MDYEHVWGKHRGQGKSGELTVMQSFRLPDRICPEEQARKPPAHGKYGYEYEAERQRLYSRQRTVVPRYHCPQRATGEPHEGGRKTPLISHAVLRQRVEIGTAGVIELNRAALEEPRQGASWPDTGFARCRPAHTSGDERPESSPTPCRWISRPVVRSRCRVLRRPLCGESPELMAALTEAEAAPAM